MKKQLLSVFAVFAAITVMTSCSSINDNRGANAFVAKMVPAKFQSVIEHRNEIVTGEAQVNVLFSVFKWGVSEFSDRSFVSADANLSIDSVFPSSATLVKQAATYNACQAAKCDVLLNAKYTITVNDYFIFKTIHCKVSGYPGMEKGLRALK